MASRFANTDDLLTELSFQINHRKTLTSLCRVSRAFNGVFTKRLYSVLRWNLSTIHELIDAARCQHLASNDRLARTDTIILAPSSAVFFRVLDAEGVKDQKGDCARRHLGTIIRNSRNLRAFSGDSTLLDREMSGLLYAVKLQDVRIHVSEFMEHDFLHVCLPALKNLRVLSLTGIAGDFGTWKHTITRLLERNTEVVDLRLSACSHGGVQEDGAPYDGRLFTQICALYAQETHQRLQLQRLELGERILCPTLETLRWLTDVERLEGIYVYNVPGSIEYSMPWDLLQPSVTPDLRRLSVQRLDDDFCLGMKTLLRAGRHIHSFEAFELDLAVAEEEEVRLVAALLADEPPLMARQLLLPKAGRYLYHDDRFRNLHLCNPITHLALPVRVQSEKPDTPEETQLALEPVYEVLPKTKYLKALWLPYIYCGEDVWHEKKRLDGEETTAMLERLAQNEAEDTQKRLQFCDPYLRSMAELCPTLQYVKFCISTWRIHRSSSEDGLHVFEELDQEEDATDGLEFFQETRLGSWPTYE